MEEAAAIPLAGLTAYRAIFTRGALARRGDDPHHRRGGGVQTFALLFANHAGARAIVTSSSDEKLERAKRLEPISQSTITTPDWAKIVRAAGPVDLVVDSRGGETCARPLDVVRPGGRIAIYGGTNGDATIKLFPLFWNTYDSWERRWEVRKDFAAMPAFRKGLRPVVDRVFSLRDAPCSNAASCDAEQFGKSRSYRKTDEKDA